MAKDNNNGANLGFELFGLPYVLGHRLARTCGLRQRKQRIADHTDVGVADDLLARKIDGDELLVDENSGDEDDRSEVERVDQNQLAAYAEMPDKPRQ